MKKKYIISSFILTTLFCIFLFLCILDSFIHKTELTKNGMIDPSIWGQFGDIIGGVIGTIFALLSSLLIIFTLLYQIKSFKIQEIENRFFQLLLIHRENVNEIEDKRKFFKNVIDTFWEIRDFVDECYESNLENYDITKENQYQFDSFERSNIAYLILFFGTDLVKNDNLKDRICSMSYCSVLITDVLNKLDELNISTKNNLDIKEGIQYALGHYFRHLFQTVNYINDCKKKLNFKKKYSYIKTLRSQLSTYEQMLLYINSISKLGLEWENSIDNWNENLITKYNLIKNIPLGCMKDIEPNDIYILVQFENMYQDELDQILATRKKLDFK
ncbi:putative phage abortive infection protein [Empedobacter sedimenti]|uniref:putative phage abortive infection protein n=1 Tax=Empedobacter sedimenti TaxID=3042610 RepID=UPI0024A728CC|nr:putative phage abortive infection protein [Empedobacter sedimenti]